MPDFLIISAWGAYGSSLVLLASGLVPPLLNRAVPPVPVVRLVLGWALFYVSLFLVADSGAFASRGPLAVLIGVSEAITNAAMVVLLFRLTDRRAAAGGGDQGDGTASGT